MAEAARRVGAHVVHVSTDYVFDGTKADAVRRVGHAQPAVGLRPVEARAASARSTRTRRVVRTSWVCGRHGANMVKTILRLAQQTANMRFVDDQRGSPTFAADLVVALRAFVVDRLPGTFHVTNQGAVSWYEFARVVLAAAGHDPGRVEPITTAELDPPRAAPRPANSVLDNPALRLAGLPLLPHYRESLDRLVHELLA